MDEITERRVWEMFYVLLDVAGLVIFSQLFIMMLPRRWWNGDPYLFGAALLKLSLAVMFGWLLLADIGVAFSVKQLQWFSVFPWRGLGLRLIPILPGFWLHLKLIRG